VLELKRRSDFKVLRAADLCALVIAFGTALVLSGQYTQAASLTEFFAMRIKLVNFIFIAAFALTWCLVFRFCGLYRPQSNALMTSEWWSVTKAVFVGTLILSGSALLMSLSAVNGIFLIGFFCAALIFTNLERTIIRSLLRARNRGRSLRNLVIVGCGPRGAEFGRVVRRKPELGYLLLGYIDDLAPPENPQHGGPEKLLGSLADAKEVLETQQIDEVVISLPIKSFYDMTAELISACEELGLTVKVPADFFRSKRATAYIDSFQDQPVVTFGTRPPPAIGAVAKRLMDVVGSFAALVVFSPIAAVCALAIKLDSPGPIHFVQDRVGLKRKPFRVIKFRTMHVDAEARQKELEGQNEVAGAAFKMTSDPRVTRVGKVLRKLSLDELPQFWNVFSGDMSLVGPRPLPFRDLEAFDHDWQYRRFSVKPGLTCLWQVHGRHEIDFDNWMELDLQYIDNWSLSLDFDILIKTLPAVMKGTGAS
jgi:exopolysaccharide biosynthesis polyprenyl glycosylphosphotransferase